MHPRAMRASPIACAVAAVCMATAFAQTVDAIDPHVRAVTSTSSPSVRLQWQVIANARGFNVLRWSDQTSRWEQLGAALPADATRYEDTQVEAGQAYEYEVRAQLAGALTGRGYVLAGLDAPLRDDPGVAVVVTDTHTAQALREPLDRYLRDLTAEGWDVREVTVAPDAAPTAVKARLVSVYEESGERLRAVVLLGAVPRAFSGRINPDGHPDHLGAWPADGYYGDLDREWTDTLDLGGAGTFANRRGDGRFDHNTYPSLLEVPVGRIDPVDLPAFAPLDSDALLRRYLDRNHTFRTGSLRVSPRAWVSDSFGYFNGEAFARVAWRVSGPLVGRDPERGRPFFDALDDEGGYLFALGVGAGTPTSAAGVGTTVDFARRSPRAVLMGLFGSYFGDWSYRDDLLRAALFSGGHTLATTWTARPYAHLHGLGALRTLGEVFLDTANNDLGRYDVGTNPLSVHQALLGDPTLRLFATLAPTALTAEASAESVSLRWSAAPVGAPSMLSATRVGYHVYRRVAAHAAEERLTTQPIADTGFTDTTAPRDVTSRYRVVTVERLSTGSGTFFNHSPGAMADTRLAAPPPDAGLVDVTTVNDAATTPPPAPPSGCACSTHACTRSWSVYGLVALALVTRKRRRYIAGRYVQSALKKPAARTPARESTM